MSTKAILALLTLAATCTLAQTTDLETWTASDGRVIQAKFIELDGESVVIEKDAEAFAVPLVKLSASLPRCCCLRAW
ncbi:MAG: hypothetical protein K1X78_10895 [Verrucomicrobiaceae bacterium]|nr:hypothetical protein [Verrucomicrobiaceae bacterium]